MNTVRRVLSILLMLLVISVSITWASGGFTGYTLDCRLGFAEMGEGECVQIPNPDFPIVVTEHFRLPWENEYNYHYTLPSLDKVQGGIYYILSEGNYYIHDTINLGDNDSVQGAGRDETTLHFECDGTGSWDDAFCINNALQELYHE